MTDEEHLIILTTAIASIPQGAPPGTGSWLRQMQAEARREVFPKASRVRSMLPTYR